MEKFCFTILVGLFLAFPAQAADVQDNLRTSSIDALQASVSCSSSVDFGATNANTCDAGTFTCTGAAEGDIPLVGMDDDAADDSNVTYHFWFTANTFHWKRCNLDTLSSTENSAATTISVKAISP